MAIRMSWPQRRKPLPAAVLMLAAVALFAVMDAGLKLLAPHYPAMQVATLRGASALPLVLGWSLATVGASGLLRVTWRLHLLRGALGLLMMAGFVYGLRTLPLSSAYSITFVAPLLITALAVPILGERVGPRRWTTIAIGLSGVLVVLRPTGAACSRAVGWRSWVPQCVTPSRRSPCACWRSATPPRRWSSGRC